MLGAANGKKASALTEVVCNGQAPESMVGDRRSGSVRAHDAITKMSAVLGLNRATMALKSMLFGLLATTAGLISRFTSADGTRGLIVCSPTQRIYTVALPPRVECLGVKGDRIVAAGSYGASNILEALHLGLNVPFTWQRT